MKICWNKIRTVERTWNNLPTKLMNTSCSMMSTDFISWVDGNKPQQWWLHYSEIIHSKRSILYVTRYTLLKRMSFAQGVTFLVDIVDEPAKTRKCWKADFCFSMSQVIILPIPRWIGIMNQMIKWSLSKLNDLEYGESFISKGST